MPEVQQKPPEFEAGKSLGARSLNLIRQALFRLITGANGVQVRKYGDRFVIQLAATQGTAPGNVSVMTITALFDTYFTADRDGAEVYVAKPWGLRRGVVWPTGPSYVYTDNESRTATQGVTVEDQKVTPSYTVGEQVLAVRLPAARITGGGVPIVWEDINQAGRCWAAVA